MQSFFVDFDWTVSLVHAGAYLNLDDILASNERTSCRLRVTLPALSPLLLSDNKTVSPQDDEHEGNSNSLNLAAGTKLELPIWLAVALGSGRRQILSVELPPIYRAAFSEVFDAGPCVVDLKRKCPYYYLLMLSLVNSGHIRIAQMATTAVKVFQARVKMIMDAALNATRHDILSSTSKFDNLELALFRIGQSEQCQLERWTARRHDKIEPAHNVLLLSGRFQTKRSRVLTDIQST